ncbi:UNVERIFIED_CONTAM: hypothetical protein Sradi_7009800 [Sesamum radiatum]|uniref:Acyl-CoA N-acyltransferase n=1 Tax=Sesamum radiatum TaxID=300843 RepID=A0AAW2JBB9_SESRA
MDKVNSQAKDNTQDMDSGEIVVSSIRAGMKREFAMMIKAQSEMGGLPARGRRMTRSPLAGLSAPAFSSCPSVVSESVQISSHSQPQTKRKGKLTRKDLRMHKSVLAEDVLPEGTVLSYVMHGEKRLEGYKKDGAIFCKCCSEVVSPSQFEAHAGFASRRKPMCRSLSYPQGIWYCKYCRNMFEREKLAEPDANAIAAGRVPGVDPLEAITQRCIRTVETFEPDIGGCAICSDENLVIQCVASLASINSKPNLFLRFFLYLLCFLVLLLVTPLTFVSLGAMISASQDLLPARLFYVISVRKEYHVGCLKEKNIDDLKVLPEGEWFCGSPCSNIYLALQKLIEDGEQRLPEDLLDVLKMKCKGQDLQKNPELGIRWRLLRGKKATEDTRVWLSGAVNIFHDRFDPIVDVSTGRLDLIPHMVYGRHCKDQDFCGMYCAVLMVDSVVVSAGIFRIFGEEVAELPLVATRSEYQGKGYFQSLFYCIEGLLASLKVKDLILPAAHEAESLWKNKFGFEKLGEEQNDKLV